MVNRLLQQHFYWCPVYIAVIKEHLTNRQIIFGCTESAFSPICWVKFLFKFVNFLRSHSRKQNGMFFCEYTAHWFHNKFCGSMNNILPRFFLGIIKVFIITVTCISQVIIGLAVYRLISDRTRLASINTSRLVHWWWWRWHQWTGWHIYSFSTDAKHYIPSCIIVSHRLGRPLLFLWPQHSAVMRM